MSYMFSRELRQFLDAKRTEFNTDLIDAFLAESPQCEVQVNVRSDVGEARTRKLPDGRAFAYRIDGNTEFKNIRYPRESMNDPDWETAANLGFPLDGYVQEIGTTWFAASGSRRVGFDIDAVFGDKAHKKGLSEGEVRQCDDACRGVDYIELRRSTGGEGRHLYILLSGFQVRNHTEHAAIARAALGKLCMDLGREFAAKVDCLGGNMWFWSRRATAENRGFECLKRAGRALTPDDIPDWHDHVDVVTRKRSRVRVRGWPESEEDRFAEMAPARVPLDEDHRRILAALGKTNFSLIENPDYGCWYCHTVALKQVHESLRLKGFFETESDGNDPGKPNAYLFARPRGVFYVVRFKSQEEHPSWGRTEGGERSVYYNAPLDLRTACQTVGAIWKGSKGATCPDHATAKRFASMFGYDLPSLETDRPVNFRHDDAHTIIVETEQVKGETVHGWGIDYRKLMVTFQVESAPELENDYDATVRHVVTTERENAGYLMRTDGGVWNWEPKDTVKDRLAAKYNLNMANLTRAIATVSANPYTLVNEPFQPEFIAGRKWNKFGAQLTVAPTYGHYHPHFDMILAHIGHGLDEAVQADPWCQRYGVENGKRYLLVWCASMIQQPTQRLPLLYCFSPERDNGKSSLHRGLSLVFRSGCQEGTSYLNEQFNRGLAGAVLVYLDEEKVTDKAAQKVKQYIEFPFISIRMMRTDSFRFPNTSHWIAAYNYKDGIPVEDGDERVVMIRVPLLYDDEKLNWDTEMQPALENEKSDFLGTLMTLELPPSATRLYVPILTTDLKREVMAANAKGEKPSCNRDELFARTVEIMRQRGEFVGQSRALREALGEGSWSASPNHLRRYLRDIEDRLRAAGIALDLSDERAIVLGRVAP